MHGNTHADAVAIDAASYEKPLMAAIMAARARYGSDRAVAGDVTTPSITYKDLFLRSFILRQKLAPALGDLPYVGVLLPNTLAVMMTFVCLHMLRCIPCMLNFSAGDASIAHACRIAGLKTVVTSRVFIERAKLDGLVRQLKKEYAIIYLEDIRASITLRDKLMGLAVSLAPALALRRAVSVSPHDPAVVLYTSGSEGVPKGVALSHANILSNIAQAKARLDLSPPHIIFNALPVFHSFGLTVGTLMPLVCGLKTFFYPSPVQYKQIPEEVQKSGATIMLGTDTFYQGYARYGEKEHFKNITLAVAGAEKLKDSTRKTWLETFGVEILQGYGVTEASPVISVNTPEEHKPGSVGRLFPSIEHRLEPVEGLEQGARLLVKGPNIMLGYLNVEKPGDIIPHGEWYDTGDIVSIDAEGYISILGRAKRFAKIAGEMVSLQVVEELAYDVDPEKGHAAIAVPDDRKGEQILLYTESGDITRERLQERARAKGVPELCLPRQILRIDLIPRLGSGKIDYISLKESMARMTLSA